MNARNPHDLRQVRPNAELDRPEVRRTAARPSRWRRSSQRRLRPPRSVRRPLWQKLGVGLVGLIAVTGIGLASVLYVIGPAELVRNELIRQVKASTGRDLRINGRTGLVFFPNLGVTLGKVQLSGPPGMDGGPTLTADRIDLNVALMPLISRKVRVEHAAIVRPIIDLRIDRDGRRSWQFAASALSTVRLAALGNLRSLGDLLPRQIPTYERARALAAASLALLDQLELGSISLTKAVIRYQDDRTGWAQEIDDLNVRLNGRRLSDPLSARGDLIWQGERLTFDARVDTPVQLLGGGKANAQITLAGRPLSASFDGGLKLGDAMEITGETRASGDSLATASRWLGMLFPNAGPLGGFTVSGSLVGNPQSVALNGATFSLGGIKASGVVLVAFRPKRPYLSADLQLSELDIDRLTAGLAGAKAESWPRASVHDTSTPVAHAKPQSIEDLLRHSQSSGGATGVGRFAPQVRGYTSRNEWSAEPIDASVLRMFDAKARLRIDGLRAGGLAINRAVLRLTLADSDARIDIDDIQLYGGGGKGVITATPGPSGLAIGANLRVDKVAAKPLLSDAAGFGRLDGRGDLVVVVSGAGNSQRAIAAGLNGTARLAFADGAIVGWNLAKMMRGLQSGQFSNIAATPNERTDFSELAASFQISRGTATTSDLRLLSPLLRVTGQGNVGIAARDIGLRLRPKLVASLTGQGAAGGALGLEIPVKLKGPWHDPRIVPDFGSISKDPEQLLGQAQKLGRQFKGKSFGDMMRGVLGGN